MFHTKKWFYSHIGKRVFRDATSCDCESCKEIIEKWFIIYDETHAEWLFTSQNDFGCEGINLNYRTKK